MRGLGMWGVEAWVLPVSGAVALLGSLLMTVAPTPVVNPRRHLRESATTLPRYPADSLVRVVVARDLFRADRRPSTVAYDPSRGATPLPEGPPKPQLLLTGVVWGEEPEAVVEGLPSAAGPRVVRIGDVVGGVTIKRIEQSRLVATGFDTTWTLTVRVPWK